MKYFRALWLFILLIPIPTIIAQSNSITLIAQDLGSLDLGAFLMSNGVSGQPRIFQVLVSTYPEGRKIYITGRVDWKQNESAPSQKLFEFQTKIFSARSFTNEEIGNSDIQIESTEGDKNLAQKTLDRGKPTGIYELLITMFSADNQILGSPQLHRFTFLNPAPTIKIDYPIASLTLDPGSVYVSFSQVQGAIRYEAQAGEILENGSVEDALESSALIIHAKNIPSDVTTYRFQRSDYLREWKNSGQKVALVVKAYYLDSGRETEIKSEPVVFNVGQWMDGINIDLRETSSTLQFGEKKEESNTNQEGNGAKLNPDATLIKVAELISGRVDQSIIDKLKDGTIQLNQVQIEDENQQSISQADFLNILSSLEAKSPSDFSILFTPKQ